jgi:hypothetical protein
VIGLSVALLALFEWHIYRERNCQLLGHQTGPCWGLTSTSSSILAALVWLASSIACSWLPPAPAAPAAAVADESSPPWAALAGGRTPQRQLATFLSSVLFWRLQ